MDKSESKRQRTRTVEVPARIVVQGSEEWVWWVKDMAHQCRTDVSKLVEVALVEHLKALGFPTEPPHRNP